MINSEMEIEKLEVWNGPSRPPYCMLHEYTIISCQGVNVVIHPHD